MRRNNEQHIGEVIKEYFEALRLSNKMKEVSLIAQWENIVGKTIAQATAKIYIHNKILYVHFNSATIRNELNMVREALIKSLNQRMGGEAVIKDIVFR